jgi:hypothetical protein
MNYSYPVEPRPEFASKTTAWEMQLARLKAATLALARTIDLEDQLGITHRISQSIAQLVPEDVVELPRGYRMTTVLGKRLLSLDGRVFGLAGVPTCLLADGNQIAQLQHDLVTGWLAEIQGGSNG